MKIFFEERRISHEMNCKLFNGAQFFKWSFWKQTNKMPSIVSNLLYTSIKCAHKLHETNFLTRKNMRKKKLAMMDSAANKKQEEGQWWWHTHDECSLSKSY